MFSIRIKKFWLVLKKAVKFFSKIKHLVPEIKVGTDYFIGAIGSHSGSNGYSYEYINRNLTENQYKKFDFCFVFRVENNDRENFRIYQNIGHCWTTNYCLCEKF